MTKQELQAKAAEFRKQFEASKPGSAERQTILTQWCRFLNETRGTPIRLDAIYNGTTRREA